jgi:hypothetical protein
MRGNPTISRHDEMIRGQYSERTMRGQEGSTMRGQEGSATTGNAATNRCKTTRERQSERMTRGRCNKRERNNKPVR